MKYKIFCDESNHLNSDKSNLMIIGAICIANNEVKNINRYIKFLKHKHNATYELKWTKLNSKKKEFYKELLDFFFSNIYMKFNAQLILNKKSLNHQKYNDGETDMFYYKMYYYTLMPFLKPNEEYNIFIDYKDTKGGQRAKKLNEVIKNSFYGEIKTNFTIIQSYESQIMQLVDVLIGAIAYKNRQDIEHNSEIKNYIVSLMEKLNNTTLDSSSPEWEEKFRIYRFCPRYF